MHPVLFDAIELRWRRLAAVISGSVIVRSSGTTIRFAASASNAINRCSSDLSWAWIAAAEGPLKWSLWPAVPGDGSGGCDTRFPKAFFAQDPHGGTGML